MQVECGLQILDFRPMFEYRAYIRNDTSYAHKNTYLASALQNRTKIIRIESRALFFVYLPSLAYLSANLSIHLK